MKKERIILITDRVLEYCLYGLIFFIPISSAVIEVFASLAILAFVVKKILQPEFRFIKNYTHLFLLLFVVFSGLSLFNSWPYLKKSLEALFFKWLEYIFIFLMAEDILANRKRLINAVVILLVVGAIVGIDAFSQRFLGIEFLRGRQIIEVRGVLYAITGPFKHYNDFAAYLICVLPLAITLFSSAMIKRIIYRVGLFFIITLLALCLLFTFSRGGWVGFLAAGLLMLFLLRKSKVVLLAISIFILMLIVIPEVRERAMFTFQAGGDRDRFVIWQGAWVIVKENPFLGKGLGTFMQYFPQYANKGLLVQYAHNCYLQMWAETGIFALLSFLLFVGSILYKGIRTFKDNRQSSILLLGFICAIFGFLVHSFFDTQLYSLQLSVLFWFLLGVVARFDRDGFQKQQSPTP